MKITVEFANLNEFKQYMGVESPNLLAQASKETEDAPASAAPAEVTEDFRITVRKQLAALNKKRGYNRATELINEQTGKGKLTEVALADLPKLMEAAKEETNAD